MIIVKAIREPAVIRKNMKNKLRNDPIFLYSVNFSANVHQLQCSSYWSKVDFQMLNFCLIVPLMFRKYVFIKYKGYQINSITTFICLFNNGVLKFKILVEIRSRVINNVIQLTSCELMWFLIAKNMNIFGLLQLNTINKFPWGYTFELCWLTLSLFFHGH